MTPDKRSVIEANIALHSALASSYKSSEPHYSTENILRVRNILIALQKKTSGKKLLDIGCGAGFIIDIAKDFFPYIRGIDVTQAMLDCIDTPSTSCDLVVQIAESDAVPYEDNSFDLCTAYAVLHHLDSLAPSIKEIYRVLKKGGIFYSDLDPNYYFWEAISSLPPHSDYSDIVQREISAVLHKDKELEMASGLSHDVIRIAEHLKHSEKGFKEENLRELLLTTGFRNVEIKYEWAIGEAKAIHSESEECVDTLRKYLQAMLPLSRHLYKYLIIYAEK